MQTGPARRRPPQLNRRDSIRACALLWPSPQLLFTHRNSSITRRAFRWWVTASIQDNDSWGRRSAILYEVHIPSTRGRCFHSSTWRYRKSVPAQGWCPECHVIDSNSRSISICTSYATTLHRQPPNQIPPTTAQRIHAMPSIAADETCSVDSIQRLAPRTPTPTPSPTDDDSQE